MELFKIKVLKEKEDSKPEVKKIRLPYDKKTFKKTTNTIFNLIFRANEVGILENAVSIRVGKLQYYSLAKYNGLSPKYNDIPITISGFDMEPIMDFEAKTYLTHEEEILFVNKATSQPGYIP